MKTLILNGSPRKNGDTASLLRIVTASLDGEWKMVNAYDCGISPCVDCRYCREHRGCCINDPMQEVYSYIEECDHILMASPIYFSELTGALLNVCSRLQTYYCARAFRNEKPIEKEKKGAVILVGGGDGKIDKPYETACTLLRHMNAKQILPVVFSHDTDNRPAADDANALKGIADILRFFNEP